MRRFLTLGSWSFRFCLSIVLLSAIPRGFAQAETLAQEPNSAPASEAGNQAPELRPKDTGAVDNREEDFLLQSIGAAELESQEPSSQHSNADVIELPDDPLQEQVTPLLNVLGTNIGPGESRRLQWSAGETSYGSKLETPVYIIRGKSPGPTLCLTSAIHGDELNGVEIVRKLVSELSPNNLHGTVIGVPIVNLLGFTRGTRYLPDRRDLNRYFPGNPNGSSASRIAFSFFEEIVRHCDLLIDLHTGSLNRTNMAQVRANLQIPEVLEFTTKFGPTAVLHSGKIQGNLRSAATNAGIPAVALELGEPGSLQMQHIEEGVSIIETVMSGLNMTRRLWTVTESQPVFYSSRWVRVNYGGLLISKVEVGERINEGAVLGSVVNPITNETFDVISPYSGRVLGMALNQFMLPGYAAFNIGIVADKSKAVVDAQTAECANTGMTADQVPEEFGCSADEDEDEEIEREDVDVGEGEGEYGPR
jgi:predicted deacylase